MEEKWLNVTLPNVVDDYEASSFGKIRCKTSQKELDCGNESKKKVTLRLKDGKSKRYPLDFIIATTFIPNPNNYILIEHLDNNVYNCNSENLKWYTCIDNPKFNAVEDLEGEIWKVIPNYPNYSVSNFGRVKSHARDILKTKAIVGIPKAAQILKPTIEERSGYQTVGLSVGSTIISYRVHKLVAEAFIPNPENKPTIDHIDLNKLNNCVDNLRWTTYKENNNNGGTSQIKVTLPTNEVLEFASIREAALKLNIAYGTLKAYCSGSRNPRNNWKFEYLETTKNNIGQRSRRKGHAFEREISNKLNSIGYNTCTSRNESKKLDNNKIDIADLNGTLPVNIQAKYSSVTPNYFLIESLCTDKSKPFTVIWKKSIRGKHSPGTLAIIPVDFFYKLLEMYKNTNV